MRNRKPQLAPTSELPFNAMYVADMVLKFILPNLGERLGSNRFTALTSSNWAPNYRIFMERIPVSFEFLKTTALDFSTAVYMAMIAELLFFIVAVGHNPNLCKVGI